MAKSSVITLPDGTKIEVSPDLSPDQISAMITALTNGSSDAVSSEETEDESGEVFIHQRTVEEIWETSKKERLALFIRSYVSDNLWFSAKDIMEQQISIIGKIELGETSAIGTYLQRLFENGYLDKKKSPNGRSVHYKQTSKLTNEYPKITPDQMEVLTVKQN